MTEEYKAHKFMMEALVGWSAVIVAFGMVFSEDVLLYSCGIFSVLFWIGTVVYFYRKTHKKPEPPLVPTPPSSIPYKVAEPKPVTSSRRKRTFIKNFVFIVLAVAEAAYFLSFSILSWEIVRIPVDGINVPVLTYHNGLMVIAFVLGLYIAIAMARILRHPRKAFFDE